MVRVIIGVACVAVLLAVVRLGVLRFGPGPQVDQKDQKTSISSIGQQPNQTEEIVLGKAPDEPIEVVKLQLVREGDRAGNLFLEIENKSETPARFVRYWLLPMPCHQYNMGNLFIDYGQQTTSTKGSVKSGSIIAPHQKASIEVEREKIGRYLKPTGPASLECKANDPEEKPHLFLATVEFANGRTWDFQTQKRSP